MLRMGRLSTQDTGKVPARLHFLYQHVTGSDKLASSGVFLATIPRLFLRIPACISIWLGAFVLIVAAQTACDKTG